MRKSVKITIIILIVAVAIGITVYAATSSPAGSADDPLVSRSYTDGEYSSNLLKIASQPINSTFSTIYNSAVESAASSEKTGADVRYSLVKGGEIALSEGSSILMASGKAEMVISAGAIADVTDGSQFSGGSLNRNHKYIVCTGGNATINVTDKAVFVCSGNVKATGEVATIKFTDVKQTDWFYESVATAVEMGLINGVNDTTYNPLGNLTLAQAIKLAACMHQQYKDGKVTLSPDDSIWYMSYVKYALSEGILDNAYASKTTKEYNAPITRQEFAHVFYKALPSDEYVEINSVKANSIPDVSNDSVYSDEIYALYRSGIIVGDTNHKFNPLDNIKRSEVAAIVTRMMDSSLRQTVTLG